MRNCSFAGYGAWELKRSYQRNLMEGLLFAVLMHLLVIGGMVWQGILGQGTLLKQVKLITNRAELGPPPTITQIERAQINIAPPLVNPPTLGTPTPVADMDVPSVSFPTQQELSQSVPSPMTGTSESLVINIPPDEILPKIEQFVPYEEPPQIIKRTPLTYPELARKAGLEGSLILSLLIDSKGKLRDITILKSSGCNVGFEDAAVQAVRQWTFSPAIQNGKPVACWLTQSIKFQVK